MVSSHIALRKAKIVCKFGLSECNRIKVVAKLKDLVAIIEGHVTAQLPSSVRFMTKQISIWSKALITPLNLWNCALSYKQGSFL